MAQHKAATDITLVQEERSKFAETVDAYKWHAAGVLVVVSGVILFQVNRAQSAVEGRRADWNAVYEAMVDPDDRAAALGRAADEVDGSLISWVQYFRAGILAAGGDPDDVKEAKSIAATAASGDSVHPVLDQLKFSYDADGEAMSPGRAMEARLAAEVQWIDELGVEIYENPPLPADATRVELETEKGTIVVALYDDLAPEHASNFAEKASSGFYDGTLFHRTVNGELIQGGDPNTIDGDPETWGQGGPGHKVPREDTGLIHTAGVLAAAKMGGEAESSGSQFYITTVPKHREFDDRYVVYGSVVEGLDVVKEIAEAPTKDEDVERPLEPVKLVSAKVVE